MGLGEQVRVIERHVGAGIYVLVVFVVFFQAEDGIRDYRVTGVQTCALPISSHTRLSCDWSSDVCSSDLSRRRHTDYRVTGVQTCAIPILIMFDPEGRAPPRGAHLVNYGVPADQKSS